MINIMASEKTDDLTKDTDAPNEARILVKVDHEDHTYMAGDTIQGYVLVYFPQDVKVQGYILNNFCYWITFAFSIAHGVSWKEPCTGGLQLNIQRKKSEGRMAPQWSLFHVHRMEN